MPDVASDELSLERRVDSLRKTIEKHNYDYFILDQPTATDAEYDALLRELREIFLQLKDENPSWTATSPKRTFQII